MTIAAIILLDSIVVIPLQYSIHLGVCLSFIYEVILRAEGLQEYIFDSPRGLGFLSDNREGILSLFGYLSLYLIAQGLGAWLLHGGGAKSPTPRKVWWRRVWILFFLFLGLWFFQDVLLDYSLGMRPSRRLCNLGYVLLVLACNCALLANLLALDLILPVHKDAHNRSGNTIIQAVSTKRNSQLFVFVVANLLTGVINIGIKTLYASSIEAIAIVLGYSFVVSACSFAPSYAAKWL
jgi:glucosaminylphosphatidylinositol acyltransferase